MEQKEELTSVIAKARHPKIVDTYVYADEIADAVLKAGFVKKPIEVTRRMTHAALLKMYPGVSTVKELLGANDPALENIEKRMAEAIYAAWTSWKLEEV